MNTKLASHPERDLYVDRELRTNLMVIHRILGDSSPLCVLRSWILVRGPLIGVSIVPHARSIVIIAILIGEGSSTVKKFQMHIKECGDIKNGKHVQQES